MARYRDSDDDDDDEGLDASEYPEPDEDDDGTAPCPYCGKDKYEESERCPHCGNYGSREDNPTRPPLWIVVTVILCLLVAGMWVLSEVSPMPDPIITLTTDFGEASPYVAAMKGVILGINPEARLVDLSHRIPAQDIRHVDYFLAAAIPYFPPGVIHVVVVDPGVGTERHLLYVEVGGHRLLLPDNGCWSTLASRVAVAPSVRRLVEKRYWRDEVSNTFHGRDILSPVAAHLSLGLEPALVGPVVSEWCVLDMPQPRIGMNSIAGEVRAVDQFGNLITNIPATMIRQKPDALLVGNNWRKKFRWVQTYGEAPPGQLVVLASSNGMIEVAVVQGNAAQRLGATVGALVSLGWSG